MEKTSFLRSQIPLDQKHHRTSFSVIATHPSLCNWQAEAVLPNHIYICLCMTVFAFAHMLVCTKYRI